MNIKLWHCKNVDLSDMGGNLDKHCGEVFDGDKLVALVSYNGRVWTTEKDWKQRKEIMV